MTLLLYDMVPANVLPSHETLLNVDIRDQSDYIGLSSIGQPTWCHGSRVLSICGTHTQQQRCVRRPGKRFREKENQVEHPQVPRGV